jgi:hypothetical protein
MADGMISSAICASKRAGCGQNSRLLVPLAPRKSLVMSGGVKLGLAVRSSWTATSGLSSSAACTGLRVLKTCRPWSPHLDLSCELSAPKLCLDTHYWRHRARQVYRSSWRVADYDGRRPVSSANMHRRRSVLSG